MINWQLLLAAMHLIHRHKDLLSHNGMEKNNTRHGSANSVPGDQIAPGFLTNKTTATYKLPRIRDTPMGLMNSSLWILQPFMRHGMITDDFCQRQFLVRVIIKAMKNSKRTSAAIRYEASMHKKVYICGYAYIFYLHLA